MRILIKKQSIKLIQSIKQTGNLANLPSQGGFFICDSHFDESCFESNLTIIFFLLYLFKVR